MVLVFFNNNNKVLPPPHGFDKAAGYKEEQRHVEREDETRSRLLQRTDTMFKNHKKHGYASHRVNVLYPFFHMVI